MQIYHHGATNGITGSCHRLQLSTNSALLINCGLFQGDEAQGHTPEIDFPIKDIEALIVTHCHIDHVGRIPWLIAAGFRGPIYATVATAKLLPIVLEDAIKIGVSRDSELIAGLLTLLQQALVPLPYNNWHSLSLAHTPDYPCKIRLQQARHILGSTYVEIESGKSK